MQPLDKTLRNRLERTVKEARDVAEAAAKAALEQLGVGDAVAPSFLSEPDKDLRRRLRVHGRQLGDSLNGGKAQTMERLIEEVAYEHWHRMLFARFLAENNLLMYPDAANPVAVTLEECDDLAKDEGAKNGWELASRFATKMLPQIFRPDSPVFELMLPPERQQKLEALVGDLDSNVFFAADSLGWVYQFWQAKRKDEVNASEVKIGSRELPAVTQLFTEPYMVAFLLDNSLGAWWAARRLSEADLRDAENEDELRLKASIPGMPLEYLRFIKREDSTWTPAAGTFDGWPEHLSELKALDPCCGSGHFLVSALLMLVPMRMELEGLSSGEAIDNVLSENIHGLEIDQRCVELAAFALALTAWRYPNAGGYRPLPGLHLACSGLSVGSAKEEWKALALDKHNLRIALDWMYEVFRNAPVLGSLLNPARTAAAKVIEWDELSEILGQALSQEQSDEQLEVGIVAKGLAKSATMLAAEYQWIITNVPYLGRGKQEGTLLNFLEDTFPVSKWDLATAFIERCLDLNSTTGITCIVSPQNWYFSARYKTFRERLLTRHGIVGVCRLGSGAFSSISGEVVKVGLSLIKKDDHDGDVYFIDAKDVVGSEQKSRCIVEATVSLKTHDQISDAPDSRIMFGNQTNEGEALENLATCYQGLVTGDSNRFLASFWEIRPDGQWVPFVNARKGDNYGLNNYIFWESGNGSLADYAKESRDRLHDMHESGNLAWGSKGIAIGRITRQVAPYAGHHFDNSVAVVTPHNMEDLVSLYEFLCSNDFQRQLESLDQKLSLTNATVLKVFFDRATWTGQSEFPRVESNDPTQWIFHGHPVQSDEPLQVAVARLLGYRWPAELDSEMDLSDDARGLIKESKELLAFADEDGIVCIPAIRGETKADDRLENLLAAAYGSDWSANKRSELLANADHADKSMETWLREKFFSQHCKLFQNRPFIWHIWDGLRDGFAALVNYHKLDYKNLETLIYTYLGDWISRQKQDIAAGVDGAQEKLAAAESLKKKLELILHGEKPYDIFVRWKSIKKQPIGWNPDINDGVRLNIRPFLTVPDVGKRGAGVLRDRPNIKWDKDRGKDVESAPWYHLALEYGGKEGDRINDHHLTLEEKRTARGD